MKRRELIKRLEDKGWYLKRHGAEHDIYTTENNRNLSQDIQI